MSEESTFPAQLLDCHLWSVVHRTGASFVTQHRHKPTNEQSARFGRFRGNHRECKIPKQGFFIAGTKPGTSSVGRHVQPCPAQLRLREQSSEGTREMRNGTEAISSLPSCREAKETRGFSPRAGLEIVKRSGSREQL